MTTQTSTSSVSSSDPSWPPVLRWIGSVLLVCWVALIAAAVFGVDHTSTLSDLDRGIASGDISVVHVSGGLPADAQGYGRLTIRWREGVLSHRVDLREARPFRAAPRNDGVQVVTPGAVDRLRTAHPSLRVIRDSSQWEPDFEGEMFRLRFPAGWVYLGLLTMVATLGLLIAGPEPWRATRWAWFWVFGIATPLGVVAYLILGGPTRLSTRPPAGAKRLTGGWAFILSVVLSGVSVAVLQG